MKSGWRVVFVLPLVVLAAAALAFGAGDAAKGKAVYTPKCGSCHGPNGEAKPTIAKMFKVEMRDLGSKEVQAKTDAQLREQILKGSGKMQPVKLSDAEVADVIAHLRTFAKK